MFTLSIPVTAAAVQFIKTDLTKTLPNIKSSHRVEAIGRALNFNTYAALLAATKVPKIQSVPVNGMAFTDYLARHNFQSTSIPFYRAIAKTTIKLVLEKEPRLSIWGYGVGMPRWSDGRWETPKEQYQKFLRYREELLSDHAADEFMRSLALISQIQPTKTISSGANSYTLKHIAENYVCNYPDGTVGLGPNYVSNGSFIVAAVYAGFKYKSYFDHKGYDHINVRFNMSKRCVDALDNQIRNRRLVA